MTIRVYLHDLRYTLVRSVLPAALLFVVFGGFLAVGAAQTQSSSITLNGTGFYYYEGNAYHLRLWLIDEAGAPVSGVAVAVIVPGANLSAPGGPEVWSATSDAGGELDYDLRLPDSGASFEVQVTSRWSSTASITLNGALQGETLLALAPGQVGGLSPLTPITTGFYSSASQILVYWGGTNGSQPSGSTLVYCTSTSSGPSASSGGCPPNGSLVLGPISAVPSRFVPPLGTSGSSVTIELLDGTGAVVSTLTYGGQTTSAGSPTAYAYLSLPPPPGVTSLGQFVGEETIVQSIGGAAIATVLYALPRSTGTLESILVRPVSRWGLFLNRYLAGVIAAAFLAVGAVASFAFSAWLESGKAPPLADSGLISLMFLGAGSAILGLVMLISLFARSPGESLLAAGGVTLALCLFWSEIASALAALGSTGSGVPTLILQIRVSAVSPAALPGLGSSLLTGAGTLGGPTSAYALAGITWATLVALAMIWSALPLALGVLLSRRWD